MAFRDHIRTAVNLYPTEWSAFRWRSSASKDAVEFLRIMLDRLDQGTWIDENDNDLRVYVDYLLDGRSSRSGQHMFTAEQLDTSGRLWGLLNTARTNALQEESTARPTPIQSTSTRSTSTVSPLTRSTSNRITSIDRAPTRVRETTPSTSRPLRVDTTPQVESARKAERKINAGLLADGQKADQICKSKEMRAIVVMNPNSHYNPTEAAVKAAKRKEQSSPHFQKYKTSMSTLPGQDPKAWALLGEKTFNWKMGNCQQIMAALFYKLSNESGWSSAIELVHNSGHHFLLIGRPEVELTDSDSLGDCFYADLWFQNLHRPEDEGGTWQAPVQKAKESKFVVGNLRKLKVDLRWQPG
jgi:hypothetical protein